MDQIFSQLPAGVTKRALLTFIASAAGSVPTAVAFAARRSARDYSGIPEEELRSAILYIKALAETELFKTLGVPSSNTLQVGVKS